jgi:ABC-type histidine transport system ATPase subunit
MTEALRLSTCYREMTGQVDASLEAALGMMLVLIGARGVGRCSWRRCCIDRLTIPSTREASVGGNLLCARSPHGNETSHAD